MKKLLIPFFVILLSVVTFLIWFYVNTKGVSSDKSIKDFLIVKGSSAGEIGTKLYKEGLIKDPLAFKIYIQLTNKSGRIQAGEYRLSPNYHLFTLVDKLLKGPSELWVTIPEGLRREEIAQKFKDALGKDDNFSNEFINESKGEEGFLFPDTYLFPKEVSGIVASKRLRATFDVKLTSQMKKDIENSGFNLEEIITLASLIERETKTEQERPIVAGVLIKRIKSGWPLQVDAALQYAVANSKCSGAKISCETWWEPLTQDDLKINSRFNTYKNPGLPPSPISNPGLSSIKAAIYPQASDFWYYIHDANGVIHFARTLEEHNQNVSTYLGK